MEFNRNVKKRDLIIFGKYDEDKYCGGIRRFEGMTTEMLKEMVSLNYADPEERQNCSPSIGELIEWASVHKGYTFDGYVVSIKRDDYRLSIDSINKFAPDDCADIAAFSSQFHNADEFDCDGSLHAWWD